MAANKTKTTDASVDAYIASRANEQQAVDCRSLIAMLTRLSKQAPKMWGPSIVGFGSYRYTYESGRTGEAPLAGFAIRGADLVVYLDCENEGDRSLLASLGKHRMGKSCLYFKRMADLDEKVLEAVIARSVAEVQRRFPDSSGG